MIVTAALAWWDEPVDELVECVRGMAQIADRVVAVDGSYRRYPAATITSPKEQAKAIRKTAEAVGLECLILTPDRLWAGQIEKRTHLLRAAAVGSDWIVVVDSDHVISADREAIRAELASSTADVVTAPYTVPLNDSRPLSESTATNWHRDIAGKTEQHRLLFRALPGLTVEKFHWWVSGYKNGQKVWVLASDGIAEALPSVPFQARYSVEHRCLFRDKRRVEAGRAFCADRVMVVEKTGQEDDVPGLPPPVFDYVRIPL